MNYYSRRRSFLKSTASAVAGYLAASCSQSPLSTGENIKFPEDVHTQNSVIDQTAVDDTPANMIIMGIFSPVVDYITAHKVRKNIMGCYLSASADTFLLNFGYTRREMEELDLLLLFDGTVTTMTADKHLPLRQLYNINPHIPDERVVCCYNSSIVKG